MAERMVYGSIPINMRDGVRYVHGRIVWLELSDGTPIKIGIDRREYSWCFTDFNSGGRIGKYDVYDIAKAIQQAQAFLKTKGTARYLDAVAKFQADFGHIDAR